MSIEQLKRWGSTRSLDIQHASMNRDRTTPRPDSMACVVLLVERGKAQGKPPRGPRGGLEPVDPTIARAVPVQEAEEDRMVHRRPLERGPAGQGA